MSDTNIRWARTRYRDEHYEDHPHERTRGRPSPRESPSLPLKRELLAVHNHIEPARRSINPRGDECGDDDHSHDDHSGDDCSDYPELGREPNRGYRSHPRPPSVDSDDHVRSHSPDARPPPYDVAVRRFVEERYRPKDAPPPSPANQDIHVWHHHEAPKQERRVESTSHHSRSHKSHSSASSSHQHDCNGNGRGCSHSRGPQIIQYHNHVHIQAQPVCDSSSHKPHPSPAKQKAAFLVDKSTPRYLEESRASKTFSRNLHIMKHF